MKEKFTNFFDYLDWRGDLSFDEAPFCEVDAVILSQIMYINLSDIVLSSFNDKITFKQAVERFVDLSDYAKRCVIGAMINENMHLLFEKCGQSRRFGNVIISGYTYKLDKATPVQFGAECFILDDKKKTLVISFEGTDDTFVGWHEDFTMCYQIPCPAQIESVKYYENAVKHFKKSKRVILTGHSKGGSNAVYTAISAKPKTLKKLSDIYNFDGPGFSEETLVSKEYLKIKDRLHNYYPHFSVIGQIYNHSEGYKIINSNENGIMQHDPCSWNVYGGSFVFVEEYSKESKFLAESINQWLKVHSDEEKKILTASLFKCIFDSGVTSNLELSKDKMTHSAKMLASFMKLEPASRKMVQTTVGSLLKICKDNLPMLNLFHFKK